MTDAGQIIERFRSLGIWSQSGQRAPHKPLLCLLAISKIMNEEERMLPFSAIEKTLSNLLSEYGPPRKLHHPEYPFWFMQKDREIWEVHSASPIPEQASGSPTRAALIRGNAKGGFSPDVYEALRSDSALRSRVIADLLESHFPETLHEDIMVSLNLTTSGFIPQRKDRDPDFREKILSAYEYRCAVCGFSVRIGQVAIALEAAHIKWYQSGGPDIHQNGLALCSLHHKLFDRGAFTVDSDHRALVSEKAYGASGFVEHLGRYHKKPLFQPTRMSYKPIGEFIDWHKHEVFLAPSRE